MSRCTCVWMVLLLGLISARGRAQQATSPQGTPAASSPAATVPAPAPVELRVARRAPAEPRLTLNVSVAYGRATEDVSRVSLAPYAALLGVEPAYTFRSGFRLGAYVQYGFGREVSQRYEPALTRAFQLDAQSSSLSSGISVAYDVPFYFVLLRYSLGLGFTRLSWDLGEIPRPIVGFPSAEGKAFGFHMLPGLSVVYPLGRLEYGLGFDYLVQSADQLPTGVLGKLTLGARLL